MASADDDFADYVSSAAPSPASAANPSPLFTPSGAAPTPLNAGSPWYALWERHTLAEFQMEGFILLLLGFIVLTHVFGRKKNRQIAVNFISSILPVLSSEFALVGFDFRGRANTLAESADANAAPVIDPETLVHEAGLTEYSSYATGRLNISTLTTNITLQRRSSPVALLAEWIASFIFDSIPEPRDVVHLTVTPPPSTPAPGSPQSAQAGGKYDNFVLAVVNKSAMRRLRTERYDLSIAKVSDCPQANWLGIMSESKEITDTILTSDVLNPILALGSHFEALIITDQPVERPTTLEEIETPERRIELILSPLPTNKKDAEKVRDLVRVFIRLSDVLVAKARFRDTVARKLKATRDDEIKKIKKKIEEETKEEREKKLAEDRKAEREKKLRGMSAEQQRKFLEKERDREQRKGMKGMQRKA
ncbi:DUF1682-domain-containing protein [Ascodesmis nigricans]|uniref:DUF1682-domain-containing protein n=1 Tax=Ascodesmis nigricans TaxID=341454 RepID=A0A4S2N4Q5_9PEZI|nr:DUF1682-domain-containing protein [Ascodesmis nigricans]